MKLFTRFKQYGFKGFIRRYTLKFLGLLEINNQLDTLNYFLNEYVDITKIPVTKDPDLRIMQLCDAEMLRIFDGLCKKHGLTYWLAFGTMLGAYRHHGFIPWDDDMDISMPRKDYEKLDVVLCEELKEYGISIGHALRRKDISINHLGTGIWSDIFPVDEFKVQALNFGEAYRILCGKVQSYRKLIYSSHKEDSHEIITSIREEFFKDFHAGNFTFLVNVVEGEAKMGVVCSPDAVYPLSSIKFEDYNFSCPCDSHKYLKEQFGDDYMSFPRTGILKHNGGRGDLSTWAKRNGIDMYELYNSLKAIKI